MNEVSLVDVYNIIKKRLIFILSVVFVVTVAAIIISLLIPNEYKAETTLLPTGGSQGMGMSSLAAQIPMAAAFGFMDAGKSSNNKILVLLSSRALNEKVVQRLDLMKVFFKKSWDEEKKQWKSEDPKKAPSMERAVAMLRDRVQILEDKKKGTVLITAEFLDPVLAKNVANMYIEVLNESLKTMDLTDAKRNRKFAEERLLINQKDLLQFGSDLSQYYNYDKISPVSSKVDVAIDIDSLNSLPSPQQEIEKNDPNLVIVRGVPQQNYLEYLMRKKEIISQLSLILSQEYEMAKIKEAKENISFQVIDQAVTPERKSKPKRAQIVQMTFLVTLIFTTLFVVLKELSQAKVGD